MKKWIIVEKETLEIKGSYVAEEKDDTSANRSWMMAEPICAHIELPEGLDENYCEAYLDEQQIKLRLSEAKYSVKIEQAWAKIREKRNSLLAETDKYMLPDYPISEENKVLMQNYRQLLRDLPEQIQDPTSEVQWPEKPNV